MPKVILSVGDFRRFLAMLPQDMPAREALNAYLVARAPTARPAKTKKVKKDAKR